LVLIRAGYSSMEKKSRLVCFIWRRIYLITISAVWLLYDVQNILIFRDMLSDRRAFQARNLCPATGLATGPCPGYIVDHIVPLWRGGSDNPGHMQWQSIGTPRRRIESNKELA